MKNFLLLLIILVVGVCFSDASTICTSASPISSCTPLTDSNFQSTVNAYLVEADEADAIVTYGDMRLCQANVFNQDLSLWCVVTETSEPASFGNAGIDPIWGAPCCATGANGQTCANGGTPTGVIPAGSTISETCSCTCPADYEGANCQTPKTPCDDTCLNGGVSSGFIVDNDCACDCTAIDYEGANCETKTPCDDTCLNGGVSSGFIVDNDCACDCTAIDYEGANCETKVTASGAKLGSAEQAGLAAAGCVVFLGLCLAVYNICYKSKSDTFKAEGLKVVEGGGNASYELASAQPITPVPVYSGELLSIKSVHTEL
ncbi:hypothetical protein TrST_g1004 [Triparma strigata]|uniref:EGF-like domain-containing protein n=1 Tax=Triparma strigata TaxID=1606541 RepID=A0A9W6ZPD0_9STRA|nr:hypothetical protein TrST_g1004 [Triparma strigata]